MTPVVFLAWQNPRTNRWFPIGRLRREAGEYEFEYLAGIKDANAYSELPRVVGFPDLEARYVSRTLFPLFANRLMSSSRPDYSKYLNYFGLVPSKGNEMLVLGRSGGFRATDNFEIFPYPDGEPGGAYQTWFFAHRLNLMSDSSIDRVAKLQQGERLRIFADIQNPADELALGLRTGDDAPQDFHMLGYLPRYLRSDVHYVMKFGGGPPIVTVEKVNPIPAPLHLRLLCRLRMPWPIGFEPFSGPEYQPIGALQPA